MKFNFKGNRNIIIGTGIFCSILAIALGVNYYLGSSFSGKHTVFNYMDSHAKGEEIYCTDDLKIKGKIGSFLLKTDNGYKSLNKSAYTSYLLGETMQVQYTPVHLTMHGFARTIKGEVIKPIKSAGSVESASNVIINIYSVNKDKNTMTIKYTLQGYKSPKRYLNIFKKENTYPMKITDEKMKDALTVLDLSDDGYFDIPQGSDVTTIINDIYFFLQNGVSNAEFK